MRVACSRLTTIIARAHRPRLREHLHSPTSLVFASHLAMLAPASSDWNHIPAKDSTPAYSIYTKSIVKSHQDDRDYRVIRLQNGLKAIIVHDPNTDKAAASLDVAVGHLYDPDDMPGLAHFCEHLLFMGTEEYPRENEYSEYLQKNNGYSNAYTSTSNTNYYFSVATPALTGALSRFAGFFHSPLFTPSCTSRELNAVDSEHKKNLQNDQWRIFQLNKHLSKPGHVWSKFGSGNRESLSRAGRELKAKGKLILDGDGGKDGALTNGFLSPSPVGSTRGSSPSPSDVSTTTENEADGGAVGRETRRRLVEWWSREYCASRMRLCVIGKEPLDELSDTISKYFSPIKNRGQEALPMISDHPFGPNEVSTLVSVKTIMSFHAVEISFPLEYQPPHYNSKPGSFLGHFVGHEGPGSLHSYLKNKGWVTGLSSGPQSLGRGFAMFKVTLHLTKDGFENHRSVILAVFKYLNLLRSSSFPAWNQQEIVSIDTTRFRFTEKTRPDDYAVYLAEHMAWPVPEELFVAAPQLTRAWGSDGEDEKVMRRMLDGLTVHNGRAVLMARGEEHERIDGPRDWRKEPVYGTEYSVVRMDEGFIKEATSSNTIPELFLPGPNEFIPTNLDVDKRDVAEPAKRPILLRETPLTTLWHKKDDQYWVPKAQLILDIRSPLANASAKNSVMTRLFSDLVNDSLTEYSYNADLAGLSYQFSNHTLGLWMSLSGYNDKMHVLARVVLERVRSLAIQPERLAIMKEQAKRDWENFFLGQSYQISDYFGRYLLTEKQWTLKEKLDILPSIEAHEVEEFARLLLAEVNFRILMVGNVYKDEALRIATMAEDIIGASALPSPEVLDRALILPEASNFSWTTVAPNVNEPNSSLTYYLHMGPLTDARLRVTAALLNQILSEPAFNVLRTQEQLGYIVSCSQWHLAGSTEAGIRIVVQSERPPVYLEQRVEHFLDSMAAVIEGMAEEEFSEQKRGLERKWTEKLKNLSEETNRYWSHINSGLLDFYRRTEDAGLLGEITKEDVFTLFKNKVHPAGSKRAKLSVHVKSQKPRPAKVSNAAAAAFEGLVRASGLALKGSADEWKCEFGTDAIPLTDFTKHWETVLGDSGAEAAELLKKIPAQMEAYPTEDSTESSTANASNVEVIHDVAGFKSKLQVADLPKPLVEWGDLPVAKF